MTDLTYHDITDQITTTVTNDPTISETIATMWADAAIAARQRHRNGLAALRQVMGRTQTGIANDLGLSQSHVAQTETRSDLRTTTLIAHLATLDATAIIRLSDGTEITLNELLDTGEPPTAAEAASDPRT